MTDEALSSDGTPSDAELANTLGAWVDALARDALRVAEASEHYPPGTHLRAALGAGLRHLLHIVPLSTGIEALAMLEVALVLRVTALLAAPAEELDDETVLRLRGETPLIEELFPAEREALWGFCAGLLEAERTTSEGAAASPGETPDVGDRVGDGETLEAHEIIAPPEALSDPQHSDEVGATEEHSPTGEHRDGQGAAEEHSDAPAAEPEQSAASERSPLVQQVREWAASYSAPRFGHRPHDLTRARSFVRTRAMAWAGG